MNTLTPARPPLNQANRPSRVVAAIAVAAFSIATQASRAAQPATGPAAQTNSPVVSVTGGRIQGAIQPSAGGAVFKGIPFAAPPVNDLRWREPQPVKPWSGVRSAAEYGSACPQPDSGWNKTAASHSSEDCLFLNVWTPDWPARTPHPVMVWIHGGGNTGGSAMGAGGIEPPFDGTALARHGVVVVTINYRLGIFGFVGHPELTAESPHHASGGYGILDQVAALRWVHDNIARFGGDPAAVTVFGQSAGSRDTTLLVASPLTKGLFQRAIAESGTPMSNDRQPASPAQVEQLGVILGQVLNAPATGTIRYLRSLSAPQLLAAMQAFQAALRARGLSLDVGMDGYAVPAAPAALFRSGQEPRIPMIIGNNGRDNPSRQIGKPSDTPEQRDAAVKSALDGYYADQPDLLPKARTIYGVSGSGSGGSGAGQVSTYPPYGDVAVQLGTDISQRCPSTQLVAWHSTVAPTWEYEFDAGNAAHPPNHSAELDFVFGYLRDQAADPKLQKLSEDMESYWTNFVKTGDPNGPGLPPWPRYTAASPQYVEFNNQGVETKTGPLRGAACAPLLDRLNRILDARGNH